MSNLTRFNSLFDDTFFNDFFRPVRREDGGDKVPAIDVHDGEGQYLVRVDLPGIKKEDISVSLENGVLSVSAESTRENTEEKDGKLIRQERRYGRFVRSLSVGADVDPAGIKASFENGVLSLTLPKVQEQQPASVSIAIE
ncbi:Hsp20/alpha crystallin family protein [Amphritea pacifica]|uniref:Hsp20/alpha crystallin family protein n=1 Tax=Amphritea pacifica TaxID=2811233 RepID=A0ABS2W3S2_9GAMM|nr:Hsp20/alpha crystallin family protein [Amphritea pacifica]MBN0986276.1 Hsp20/alpha crystallin family protein [Amphritea pacifica]MBN1006967.1 Hsp20/alpha crystallin family protein [Amphritea pacifica]